jgi:hypothetical protein
MQLCNFTYSSGVTAYASSGCLLRSRYTKAVFAETIVLALMPFVLLILVPIGLRTFAFFRGCCHKEVSSATLLM